MLQNCERGLALELVSLRALHLALYNLYRLTRTQARGMREWGRGVEMQCVRV